MFGMIKLPFMANDLGWIMPGNLTTRMVELKGVLRPGRVLDIPRVLNSVNDGREWNAIILPLTEGSVDEAKNWWNNHKDELLAWSILTEGTPLDEDYITEARAHITVISAVNGNNIPLN